MMHSPLSFGEVLTIWLVRIAMLGYFGSLLLRISAQGETRRLQLARMAWTAGYVFFLLHLATAFHYVHHWSHDHAYEVTAQRTQQTLGSPYGEGIYFNYAFMLVWGLDVVWWWTGVQQYERRPRWVNVLIQSFMAFIVFNATVVFTLTSLRWWGLAGTGALLLATGRKRVAKK